MHSKSSKIQWNEVDVLMSIDHPSICRVISFNSRVKTFEYSLE